MKTRTLAQMRASCRQRADMETTQFCTDAEINAWLNEALCSLWDNMIRANPDIGYTTGNITSVVGTPSYTVPVDFYKHRGVDQVRGNERIPLEEFEQAERVGPLPTSRVTVPRFRIRGNGSNTRIWFDPDPGANSYVLHYVTACPVLTVDADTFDGIDGWEKWPILTVAITMLNKEKQDTRALERELAAITATITKAVNESRNAEREISIAIVRPSFRRGTRRVLDW